MSEYLQRATRVLAIFVAMFVLVSVAPSMIGVSSPISDARAADEAIVNVGWLNGEVQNWNPLKIEMIEDYVVCYLMYSSLWYYDEDWGGPVGDLALTWNQTVHADGTLTTYVNLTENAFFRDSTDPTSVADNLEATDVVYTFELIMANPGFTFDWYLANITNIEATQKYQVRIDTDYTKATLIDDLSMVPILSEDYWSTLSNPLGSLSGSDMYGSGPFLYDSELSNSWWLFKKAPNYHGAADYPEERDIDFDGIMYTLYTDSNSIAIAMTDGLLDTINLYGDTKPYLETLDAPGIIRQAVQEPGITDIAINAIPETFDTPTYYDGNPVLRDPAVRKAIMMCLDKDFIVNDMLYGLPVMADSVVQPNDWYYSPQNQLAYDPAGAKAVLIAAGYDQDDDSDGIMEAGPSAMAVDEGWCNVGDELSGIRCQAPDTDPNYYAIAQAWQGWAADGGIGLVAEQKSEGVMTNIAWYKCDYDIWVWHWGWGPEPMGGALSCWMISEIETGGDNCQMPMGSWWYDDENYTDAEAEVGIALTGRWSEFDQVMSEAQRTVDVEARKLLVDDLQQMVYDSYSENPPYYDLGLYAYSEANFVGWGNWTEHPGRTTSSDLLWVWYDLETASNVAPTFVSELSPTYQTLINDYFEVTVDVEDENGDELMVNCSWGDGSVGNTTTVTGDTTLPQSVTFRHYYTELATGLDLEATVTDKLAGHTVTSRALIDVVDVVDFVPVFGPGSPLANPVSPAYIDDEITWSATVSDVETGGEAGEVIKFTWDWGDGTYDVSTQDPASEGASVTDLQVHSWDTQGTYRVTVYAFDGYNDDETNSHNVSVYRDYVIKANTAPTSLAISAITWAADSWAPIVGSAIDADPDTLTFTWAWDDGSFNVTEVDNTAPGTSVTNNVMHMWTAIGTYPVTLYVDDGMGHNVSTTTDAVISAGNIAPTGLLGTYSPDPSPVGATVTFTVSAYDANGDALTFWVDFGDDSEMETASSVGGTTGYQSVTFEHVYESEGPFEATISVEDAEFNVTSTITVEVVVNEPPTLNLQSSYSALYNQEFTVAPSLCEDTEGDEITVWYDFGDGTDMEMGAGIDEYYAASHTYMTIGTFTLSVYADDGMGNNVTATASVSVTESNLKPTVVRIVKDPSLATYEIGQEIVFNVTIKDPEGDTVTVDIAFGDGTTDTEDVETEANVEITVEFTHAYETGGVSYTVLVNATDGMDHSNPDPASKTTTVQVDAEKADNTAIYIALGVIAIVAVLAALLLMKRKKKGQIGEGGGMEGMAPPEPPPSG